MKFDRERDAGSALADFPMLGSRAGGALLCVATLLPAVLLWGCAGIVSGQSTTPPPPSPPQTYSISGTISPIAGGSGATVLLSGAAGATTVAISSGNYSFAGLASGTYSVTPSNTGYIISPVNQSVIISAANVSGVNFTATAQVPHTVALTWNPSTSTVSGYNVYRSIVSGTGYTRLSSLLGAVLSYTDSNVLNGTTYYYVTTAVDAAGVESNFSNEASAVIP